MSAIAGSTLAVHDYVREPTCGIASRRKPTDAWQDKSHPMGWSVGGGIAGFLGDFSDAAAGLLCPRSCLFNNLAASTLRHLARLYDGNA